VVLYMNSPETKFTSSGVADLTSSEWKFGSGDSYGILNGSIQEKIIYLTTKQAIKVQYNQT
jgi:hypothetical protein